jgi:hypothetical protein
VLNWGVLAFNFKRRVQHRQRAVETRRREELDLLAEAAKRASRPVKRVRIGDAEGDARVMESTVHGSVVRSREGTTSSVRTAAPIAVVQTVHPDLKENSMWTADDELLTQLT